MENSKKTIERMKTYFKKNKSNSYPITNHPLEKEDDYIKGLYITMLFTIINSQEKSKEEQQFFIERIANGVKIKDSINEYIKKSYDLEEKMISDFVNIFKDSTLKYNFFIDALIVLFISGEPEIKSIDFVADLADILTIKKQEVYEISELTKIILEQDKEKYKEFCSQELEIDIRLFFVYIEEFVEGLLSNNSKLLCIKYKQKTLINDDSIVEIIERSIESNVVIIENIIIKNNTENNLKFQNCEKITIKNCEFESSEYIYFSKCKNINIESNIYKNQSSRAIKSYDCDNIEIKKCKFESCKYYSNAKYSYGYQEMALGGAIYACNMEKLSIDLCEFNYCTTSQSEGGKATGSIAYFAHIKEIDIRNSTFYECESSSYRYGWSKVGSLFATEKTQWKDVINCTQNNRFSIHEEI
ncbi:MAG: hypothetical protein SPE00_05635 [Bacilli bacterium]|nr:hypothetical protein [Bacilli bacterium]